MAKTHFARADLRTEVADLRAAIERLSQQVHLLTSAKLIVPPLDFLGQFVEGDADHSPPPPFVLRSMPLDPTTPDCKINQARPPRASPEPQPVPPARQTLFD